ncbi:Coq4 family protein [Allocoleopsis sp.]|uniref:Coq4 family protein n=1 Tax=Allocoleopsis sp. TaxID=3088169 RepID=UPI002FD4B1CA
MMVSTTQPLQLKDWTKALNPLAHTGINGSEFRSAYAAFLKHEPVSAINHIIAAGRGSHWQHWVDERRARQAAHLANTPVSINIPELLELPEFTLGGAYARHIVNQGFDPEAFMSSSDSPENWVEQRMALSHDVYHIITGFDGSPMGEFGLAGFCFVQFWDLLNAFVLSFLPLQIASNFKQAPQLFGSLIKGFIMGMKSKPIFAYQFEANWNKPVSEVRQELGISGFVK